MQELIFKIIAWLAPTIAGVISTIVIPCVTKRVCTHIAQRKIDEMKPSKMHEEEMKLLQEMREEILVLRGKKK